MVDGALTHAHECSVIYDVGAPDNEERSADLLVEFARDAPGLTGETRDTIFDWIIATKKHQSTIGESDKNYFLVRCSLGAAGNIARAG